MRSACGRCSSSNCGSARGRAPCSRCRCFVRASPSWPRWPRSPRRASRMQAARSAVTFLTRFPLVGAGVGAAVGGAAVLFHAALPPFVAAVLALVLGALLTGALHLDGLADTADALGSRERALEIMRDPRIGSFGAIALVLDLLAKSGALAALLEHGRLVLVALVAGALSRAVAAPLALALPYARAERGLLGRLAPAPVAASTALTVALAVVLLGARGAIMAAAAAGPALLVGASCRRRLGGYTGDTLGAAIELT